jgi:phage tail sheath protein FI
MPEYLAPGVYVEETSFRAKSIEGVGTSTTAFVGPARKGPFRRGLDHQETPEILTSYGDFERLHGGHDDLVYADGSRHTNFLAHAVLAYFNEGGSRLYVSRVVSGDAAAASVAVTEGENGVSFDARFPGSAGNGRVIVREVASPASAAVLDRAPTGSLLRTGEDDDLAYFLLTADGWQSLAEPGAGEEEEEEEAGEAPDLTGSPHLITLAMLAIDGDGAQMSWDDLGFDRSHPRPRRVVHTASPCWTRRRISPRARRGRCAASIDSRHAALYYPWVVVANPEPAGPAGSGHPREIALPPPASSRHLRAQRRQRGVHKAPANEVVPGALRFERTSTSVQQEVLNPIGINCLRSSRGAAAGSGARADLVRPGVEVRQRAPLLQLPEAVHRQRGTQWAVFEPNGERLWANVRRPSTTSSYNEWRSGALLGDKPEEAYFVSCDRSTMTQNDLDNGRLICLVGVAALKPAEFVIFRIGQKTADARSDPDTPEVEDGLNASDPTAQFNFLVT